LPHLWAACSP
jgi:hypothetical protein